MIPRDCKRLAEVDFPIAVVSKHSAREKSIRHGHPSTLHLWWARRPLAACRAMLLALLLPDPCDEHCAADFKTKARSLLPRTTGNFGATDVDLRRALLKFIGDFADWDLASNPTCLEVSRGLVKAAHGDETPLVVDPFAGGGAIPLEALRLGCEAFASDLNPVSCLILKVLLQDIPRHGARLGDELRRVGLDMKEAAERELAEFYPPDHDGARPIAYLWARTVRCEAPNCGAEIPLVRSFWLSNKAGRRKALKYNTRRPNAGPPYVEFEIFEPQTDREVPGGTVTRAKATCVCCNTVLLPDRVRAQLREQRGGADATFDTEGERTGGARMLAVVTLTPGQQGRGYRLPTQGDYRAVWNAHLRLQRISGQAATQGLSSVPDEPLPLMSGTFNVPIYGMNRWGDLFTARQKLALVTLARLASAMGQHSSPARDLLALAIDKLADLGNALTPWKPDAECPVHLLARQAIGMGWDWAEAVPISEASGSFLSSYDRTAYGIEETHFPVSSAAAVQLADACQSPLPDQASSVWFTDPPYYFAVPYADLSDFFFVWLKRALPHHPLLLDPFDPKNPLTPKDQELCEMAHWDQVRYAHKNQAFFEDGMRRAFAEGRRVLREDGVGAVVFAHKTTEGWEALLSGMVGGGWTITGSWPIATEMATRLRARESAALATSVHLLCRPRSESAPIGDWSEVLRELPRRVREWIDRLQGEGVRGADLVFACIGPALEIYSRYSKVVDAEEREIPLGGNPEAREPYERGYLAYVWEVVGRTALEQVLGQAESKARNGAAGALEEDARLTALFLWTLQSTSAADTEPAGAADEAEDGDEVASDEEDEAPRKRGKALSLPFDVVRRFAQPLGIHLGDWEDRVIETDKGVVFLLPVGERAKQLFGEDGAQAVADRIEQSGERRPQLMLFTEEGRAEPSPIRGRHKAKRNAATPAVSDEQLRARREATTLDRLHAAMLLQKGGRANALRAFLRGEQERGPEFLRLANALTALYPKGSEEKRLLDAMLLAVPR